MELFDMNGNCVSLDEIRHRNDLFFHGTRADCIKHILKDGFRLFQGYTSRPRHLRRFGGQKMFGDAFYFADVITKALKFCKPHPIDGTKYILVCKLNFGDTPLTTTVDNYNVGKTYSAIIGLGKYNRHLILEDPTRPLNYYEYAVYDPKQIEIVYVLKC